MSLTLGRIKLIDDSEGGTPGGVRGTEQLSDVGKAWMCIYFFISAYTAARGLQTGFVCCVGYGAGVR